MKNFIKDYGETSSSYQEFQNEVQNFLREVFSRSKIDIVEVKQRPDNKIKSIESISENHKTHGKYKEFTELFEIKDIAGVRIICHCEDDLENADQIVDGVLRQKYDNIEREVKGGGANHGKSSPSYRAIHYTFTKQIILQSRRISISCEVQIKTVMADAWAVQDRKYVYGKVSQGDAQDLTQAVATIMEGCEKLWTLVKQKAASPNQDSKDIVRTSTVSLPVRSISVALQKPIVVISDWVTKQRNIAWLDFQKTNKKGFMQVKASVPSKDLLLPKEQMLKSARESAIHTFGWPIGVFLDVEDYRPKPDIDGIHARVLVDDKWDEKGRKSFDYWAIHSRGAFFLLKSIFEDDRDPNALFFDTRIVRITETILYLRNLYSSFGVFEGELIQIEITHGGLKNRTLTSASPRRSLWSKNKNDTEDEVVMSIETTLEEIDSSLPRLVERFTEPLFEQFNFFKLSKEVLEDIVFNYKQGKIV